MQEDKNAGTPSDNLKMLDAARAMKKLLDILQFKAHPRI